MGELRPASGERYAMGSTLRNADSVCARPLGGCSDRGHTAIAALKPGEIDWDAIFGAQGARWFHTGGIFCALSETTPDVALEAMQSARKHGVVVSYDLKLSRLIVESDWRQETRAGSEPAHRSVRGCDARQMKKIFPRRLVTKFPARMKTFPRSIQRIQENDCEGCAGFSIQGGSNDSAQSDDGDAKTIGAPSATALEISTRRGTEKIWKFWTA